jgi:RimJ/RimL family protein N-acetyltransferase
MKPTAELQTDRPIPFSLRTMGEDDIELLRDWKNEHRQFFFHKDIISREQQQGWFGRFEQARDDHMFVVMVEGRKIGCMGVRLLEGGVDVYNVILGVKGYGRKGIMSAALNGVCAYGRFLYPGRPVQLRVLTDNPAVPWYEKNGFQIIARRDDHLVMELKGVVSGQFRCRLELTIPMARSE